MIDDSKFITSEEFIDSLLSGMPKWKKTLILLWAEIYSKITAFFISIYIRFKEQIDEQQLR